MKACFTYCTVLCQPDKYDDAFFTGKKRQWEKKMYCIISRSEQRLYISLYFLQTRDVVFQLLPYPTSIGGGGRREIWSDALGLHFILSTWNRVWWCITAPIIDQKGFVQLRSITVTQIYKLHYGPFFFFCFLIFIKLKFKLILDFRYEKVNDLILSIEIFCIFIHGLYEVIS